MPWLAPWLFLAVSLVGACFTFNAYLPHRGRSPLIVPSFFAGWLTGELSGHHFAWQLAATLAFAWAGALEAWPGLVGLGVTLASWLGLGLLLVGSARTRHTVEQALAGVVGHGPSAAAPPAREPSGRLLLPFWLHDPAVEVVRDLRYAPGAGRRHLLDVYRHRDGARDAPVLLQIHGGAWVIGDKRQQALPLMLHLAARGWVCVAANYRLSPKATFPEHLVDVKRALAWIREQVAAYGGDPGFVVLTGGSAGGHLAALAALTADDPEYQPGFEQCPTSVAACVPFYGVYDVANELGSPRYERFGRYLARLVMKTTLAEDPAAYAKASPLARVHPGAPPFFVIHGTHDSLAPVEGARAFAERLRRVSAAPALYAELPGAQHAFEVFHSLRTRHVVRAVERFLAHLHAGYRRQRAA